jgi:oligoribonuclease
MNRQQHSTNLAWLDLEMSGLCPQEHVILQAALIITNDRLEPLEELCLDIWQPAHLLSNMSPFVRNMHDTNGLLERSRASKVEVRNAEQQLIERITGWCPYPAVLCGNTIAQDRSFIDKYMPGLAGYLHYRMLDVSALKVLLRLWYGDDAEFKKPEAGAHDALFDIRQSIAELKFYQSRFLKPRG